MPGILILGAGGHARVIADILRLQGHTLIGFLDDNAAVWNTTVCGLPVLGATHTWAEHQPDGIIIGIGANAVREQITAQLGPDAPWISAIHPRTIVAASAVLAQGVVVAAGGVINPDVIIAEHVIINTGATVDHDCTIDAFAHVAPGANLAGGVRVGARCLIGVGAAVLPYRRIGRDVTVSAGAVVEQDLPDGVTLRRDGQQSTTS